MKTEYIRNLNHNFAAILPEQEPDVRRYQYRILERGGLKYLLPCTYRNLEGRTYLYYDITSNQNVRQLFSGKCIDREWMKAFLWSMEKLYQELNRFLLDEQNIVWSPEYIFQNPEKHEFLYTYLPYEGQEGRLEEDFEKMLEFWTEKVDYEDEPLSEFVYYAYEKYAGLGLGYLEKQIFDDFARLEEPRKDVSKKLSGSDLNAQNTSQPKVSGAEKPRSYTENIRDEVSWNNRKKEEKTMYMKESEEGQEEKGEERRRILPFWESRKKKQEQKSSYREDVKRMINGYAVCEEGCYGNADEKMISRSGRKEEEYGRTIYIEEKEEITRGLYTEQGKLAVRLDKFPFVLGKKKEDTDYVLEDYSASRVHARLTEEEGSVFLEDLNSTNGTYKNGLRMLPYEKRQLEAEDVIRFGKTTFVFK